jgi:MarR family transcriptional regulator, organic hydroperoxide resistance regulator
MRTNHLIALASALRFHALEFLTAELRRAGIDDLIPSHGAVLSMLFGRGGAASMKELVAASGRGKSTFTEMVKALERRGYVVRSKDPEDARGVRLEITDKARALQPLFETISLRLLEAAWGEMPPSDREQLSGLLESVVANLKGTARRKP